MRCACGAEATANGTECPRCFLARLRSVRMAFSPTRSAGAGQIDPEASRRWMSRLEDYARVRKEGSQPRSTRRRDIDEAKRQSDLMGAPYRR